LIKQGFDLFPFSGRHGGQRGGWYKRNDDSGDENGVFKGVQRVAVKIIVEQKGKETYPKYSKEIRAELQNFGVND